MLLRSIVAVIGLLELVVPRRFARFWVRLACKNPEDVELRPWVTRTIRLEGVLLLAWVAWTSRDQLSELPDRSELSESIDVPDVDIDAADETSDALMLREGTTRFDIAAVLYHADDPLAVSELVELSEGSDWEVGRSTASATLYRMHTDGLVKRQEREGGRGFEYWLADSGVEAVESADGPVAPDPFESVE